MNLCVFSCWLIECEAVMCEAWFDVNSIHPSSGSFQHFSPSVHDTNARFTCNFSGQNTHTAKSEYGEVLMKNQFYYGQESQSSKHVLTFSLFPVEYSKY